VYPVLIATNPPHAGPIIGSIAMASQAMSWWKLTELPEYLTVNAIALRLREAQYYVPRNTTKSRLRELDARCQRGLLSYGKCSKPELLAFSRGRHLTTADVAPSKSDLVALLETADDNHSFDLMRLPPELRQPAWLPA